MVAEIDMKFYSKILLLVFIFSSVSGDEKYEYFRKLVVQNDYISLKKELSNNPKLKKSDLLLWAQNADMSEFLINQGFDPNTKGQHQNMTTLMESVRNGNLDQCKIYLSSNVSINAKDDAGRTALHYASGNLNLEIALLLIEKGAYIDAQDYEGETPMMRAVRDGDDELVYALSEAGANKRLLNKDRLTVVELVQFSTCEDSKKTLVDTLTDEKGSRCKVP